MRRVCHIQYKYWCKQTNDPKKPKGHHLGNARANTARIVVLSAVRFVQYKNSMSMTSIVEVTIWAVFGLFV